VDGLRPLTLSRRWSSKEKSRSSRRGARHRPRDRHRPRARGCDVAISDIAQSQDGITVYPLGSDAELAVTAGQIRKLGRKTTAVQADVTKADDVEAMMQSIEERLGGLDILVANAGIIMAGAVASMSDEQWKRIFDVNVHGVFQCARAAIPRLAKRGGGRIINIASVAGEDRPCGPRRLLCVEGGGHLAHAVDGRGARADADRRERDLSGLSQDGDVHAGAEPAPRADVPGPEDEVFEQFVQRRRSSARADARGHRRGDGLSLPRRERDGITLTVAGGGEVH
jgi:hypothetical protein